MRAKAMPASAGTLSDFNVFIIECLPEWLRILCESITLNDFRACWIAWHTTSFLMWDFPVLSGKRYFCPVGQYHSSLKLTVPRTPQRLFRTTAFPFFLKPRSVGRMALRSTLLTWTQTYMRLLYKLVVKPLRTAYARHHRTHVCILYSVLTRNFPHRFPHATFPTNTCFDTPLVGVSEMRWSPFFPPSWSQHLWASEFR